MDKITEFLANEFMGNSYWGYLWFFLWLVGALILKGLTAKIIINLLAAIYRKKLYDIPPEKFREILSKAISQFIFIAVLYVSIQYLQFPPSWNLVSVDEFGLRWITSTLYGLAFGVSLIYVFLRIIDCAALILSHKYRVKINNPSVAQVIPFASDLVKVVVAALGALVILATLFNVNIAALVAGLGIGGLAIALAAKETLENLLGSFIIYFDQPFKIGDTIKLGDDLFIVEKVGLRSTRLRTYGKTLMTIPNKTLIESRIDNYTLIEKRTINRFLKLSRDTKHSQITDIIRDLTEYIKSLPRQTGNVEISFHQIGDSSLDLRMLYYLDATWAEFLEDVEKINLKTLEIIEDHGAQLAIPSQLIHLPSNPYK